VLSVLATKEAIKRAKAHGIGAVGVRNSNHFGTCMYYTLMGAREGCMMFLTTNGGPAMAPWGGNTRRGARDRCARVCSRGSQHAGRQGARDPGARA